MNQRRGSKTRLGEGRSWTVRARGLVCRVGRWCVGRGFGWGVLVCWVGIGALGDTKEEEVEVRGGIGFALFGCGGGGYPIYEEEMVDNKRHEAC